MFQLLVSPGLAAWLEEPVDVGERVFELVAGAVVAAALYLRRERPAAVLGVVVAVGAASALVYPFSASTVVPGVADLVALYSLAVHRPARTAVTGGALAGSVYCLVAVVTPTAPMRGLVAMDVLATVVLTVACCAAVIAFGQLRRQRVGARLRLAARLEAAERERRLLAAAERERLARDLHDVAGHHLSAATVHSTAALRLAERRPEMVAEALAVAVGMGKEALAGLNRLVDVVGVRSEGLPGATGTDLPALISPLCAGLARIGIPVSVTLSGESRPLPGGTVAAAYGVVQESLTNAMRHAMGAPIAVNVGYGPGRLDVHVRNGRAVAWSDAAGLGGGRGLAGMSNRVAGAGGTLWAGPDGDGWTVHAVLPAPAPAANRFRREFGWPELLDFMALGMCVGLPLLAIAPAFPAFGSLPLSLLGVLAVLSVHALPLWWRRTAPAAALAALAAFDLVWGVLTLAGVLPTGWLVALALAWITELIAVYSLTAYGPSAVSGLLGAAALAAVGGLAAVSSLADDSAEDPLTVGVAVWAFGYFGIPIALAFLPFWIWGAIVRHRRRRGGEWERSMAEAVAVRTDHIVRAERYQVAAGLRGAVLDHTIRLVRTGESALRHGAARDQRAALTVVAAEARAALAGMRDLLDTMEATTDTAAGDTAAGDTAAGDTVSSDTETPGAETEPRS